MAALQQWRAGRNGTLLLLIAGPVFAQTVPPETTAAENTVVISAQKREEAIQRSAISVTAITAEQLQNSGVQTVSDVARLVPGLNVVTSGPGQNILIMRGIASSAGSAGTVGYYLDNTPVAASSNASLLSLRGVLDPAMLDILRVEVLRGPQGSLYGSSSMGGTVRYISKMPDPNRYEWDLRQQLSHTQDGGWNMQTSAAANLPLIENTLAARIAVFYRWQDGFIQRVGINPKNLLALPDNMQSDKPNTEKTTGIKTTLRWWLPDGLSITASALQQRTVLGAPFQVDAPPGSISNLVQTRLVPEPGTQVSALAAIDIRKQFEQFELLSSTSYYYRSVTIDEDASRVINAFFSPPQTRIYPVVMIGNYTNREFTQELRFTSDWKGPWQFVGGAYYHHVNAPLASQIPVTDGYNTAFGTSYQSFFKGARLATTAETALFGEASYQFSPNWSARLGLRAFRIHQSFAQQVDGEFVGGKPSGVTGDAADHGINPKLNLSWQATPDQLWFVTASKGYRAGGPNNPAPEATCGQEVRNLNLNSDALRKFSPDSVWNYEIGSKTSWDQRRITLNATAYQMNWQDIQQQIVLQCGFNLTANFGSATSRGLELELAYRPSPQWQWNLTLNHTRARLNNDVPGTPAKRGDRLPDVPEWTMAFGAEYRGFSLWQRPAFIRFDHSYTGSAAFLYDRNSPFYQRGSYHLSRLMLGLQEPDKTTGWSAQMFIDNLFNSRGATGLPVAISADLPDTRRIAVLRPRTVGLSLHWRY
ncbi:TonB-dependent receptor [Undibacterium squillarum]|uniref:TonB-dependent receptor n=1 Tax=Undibacterium squillarum TaxID=1131567 RepID=A0ABQ2XV35_9BURK|nr:TonB-dependent receptor [Undibacterium squillarum]GGX34997.1 TonB-dependent receptor [Undibacterium squillarum]